MTRLDRDPYDITADELHDPPAVCEFDGCGAPADEQNDGVLCAYCDRRVCREHTGECWKCGAVGCYVHVDDDSGRCGSCLRGFDGPEGERAAEALAELDEARQGEPWGAAA